MNLLPLLFLLSGCLPATDQVLLMQACAATCPSGTAEYHGQTLFTATACICRGPETPYSDAPR